MVTNKQKTVTKAELAAYLAHLGISQRYARKVVDHLVTQLADALERGEIVHLVGFGSFHYKYRNSRQGRNPKTGEKVAVPMKRVIQFRPGGQLKKLVRE